jgi:hypothetical protein
MRVAFFITFLPPCLFQDRRLMASSITGQVKSVEDVALLSEPRDLLAMLAVTNVSNQCA